ncbi:MFS transporter [Micromonospora sp. MH99]|uniref:MFS transporter n=1 Tax=Micromonospora sp. MH99 TaxID=1945510 RepID=UPI001F46E6F8|nr:MFS transporter [Micromonospora sp. MH99]
MTDHEERGPRAPDGVPVLLETPDRPEAVSEPVGVAAAVRARWAVTGVFFVNGLLLSTYITRIPSIKAVHQFGDAQFGMILTLLGVAALLTMQFVGGMVARFGSSRVIRTMLLCMPLALAAVGFARTALQLAVAVILLGIVHGATDVAMNGHAVVVERVGRRPIMNGCHAAWSISAVLASLVGVGLIKAGIAPSWHLAGVAIVMLAAALPLTAMLLPASVDRNPVQASADAKPRASWRTGWSRRVLMYGAMGATLMVCEAAVTSWSGIYLHEIRGAELAVASLAFTAYTAFQTLIRLFGDRLTERFGGAVLFRVSGLVGIAGIAVVVLVPSPYVAIAGFAILGAGTAVLLPLIFSAVGHAGGDGPGATTFVARATTFAYGGILLGPAMVGWFAAVFGLTWTFAGLLPLMAAIVLNSRVMGQAGAATDREAAA